MDFSQIDPNQQSLTPGRDFDALLQTSRILWGEVSFDGLVKRFVGFLRERFAIRDFSLIALPDSESKKGVPAWQQTTQSFEGMRPLRDSICQDVMERVLALGPKCPELREGLIELRFGGREVHVSAVSEPSGGQYILAWHKEDEGECQTRRGLTSRVKASSPKELLEFVVRQFQCQCTWFGLLDRTQSLLYRDELTGLFNYRYLEVAVETELRRAQRFHSGFSLLFVDIDDFKAVNDQFGHLAGSDVLRQVGKVLLGSVREVDSVIRYGGDEYVVVLLGANSKTAMVAAERIRSRIAKNAFRVDTSGKTVNITVSIGAASYPEHGRDKDGLLHNADLGMYRGKKAGKNRAIILSPAEAVGALETRSAGAEEPTRTGAVTAKGNY